MPFSTTERVEIIIQPDDGEFTEGNTVILACVATGYPDNPNITWWRDGDEIDSGGEGDRVRVYQEVLQVREEEFVLSTLEICGLTREEAGLYSCSARLESGLSAESGSFWVNVTAIGRKSFIGEFWYNQKVYTHRTQ